MALVSLLGDTVVDAKGQSTAVSSLESLDAVLIYFSAHWCGPCRQFTPELAKIYKRMKAANINFDLVFSSSDRDLKSFNGYLAEMPWKAVPFSSRDISTKLSAKFKVDGIPTLVVVDAKTGKLLNKDGRTAVTNDPTGAQFPWRTPTLAELIDGAKIVDGSGEQVDTKTRLADKVVGFYFSAHWCPPCRGFTPKLIATYKKLKSAGANFEIVFVSSDKDADSFRGYFGSMPWTALDFADRKRKQQLSSLFGVEGIPHLAIVDMKTGKTINAKGRGAVESDPNGNEFPWPAKLVDELNGSSGGSLNESASLIVFCGGADDSKVRAALATVAEQRKKAHDAKGDDDAPLLGMFYAKQHPIIQQVKQFMKVSSPQYVVGILDIPARGWVQCKAIKSLAEVTADSLAQFAAAYDSGELQMVALEQPDE